ncbi:MAG: hypothetical protein IBJ11_11685 [Phycisphaerales bacterium]|nr:hypothetical protein [Phycisphaerales bacterium]
MNASDVRKILLTQPFEPFEILMVDGRRFLVDHPDFLFVPPVRASWVLLVHPDGTPEQINTLVISSIRRLKPRKPAAARARRRKSA